MQIQRIAPILTVDDLATAIREHTAVLGMQVVMDMGWIAFVADEAGRQIGLMTTDASAPVNPDVSVFVDDVEGAHAAAVASGADIVHPLTTEAWGVRRFFYRDSSGRVVNVGTHTHTAQGDDAVHYVDHEPGSWFLVTQGDILHLDARFSHSAVIDSSVLIRLDDSELEAYRSGGHDYLSALALRIHDSAPHLERSPYHQRDLYAVRRVRSTGARWMPRSRTTRGRYGNVERRKIGTEAFARCGAFHFSAV